ncbi:CPVL [Lepeophtheirus salmonis]|uniref:CPVL n=1 Tax=Lepeophtheirus salmonis TaxID=72036 RepID=A0A7R8D264_LEPSM|nr:CPVL [Lepeophtheirus salmonis]CAF2954798.1 CPVL [Lepeophtheirus salmonis]
MTTPVLVGCSTPNRHHSFDVSNIDSEYDQHYNLGRRTPSLSGRDSELDRLRREKISSYFLIERYKLYITYAIVFGLFGIIFAVCMGAWKIMEKDPSLKELRERMMKTPREGPRICSSAYPNLRPRVKTLENVGEKLLLTPLIEKGLLDEARDGALVTSIMQTDVSYSGAPESPLLLWLQGGPGWSSLYGLFKENGPFLVGWDYDSHQPYLLRNEHSWHKDHNVLYIDNPVGTGFSYADNEKGYLTTDEEVAEALIEAIRQFMILYPKLVPEAVPPNQYLEYKDQNSPIIKDIYLAGVGIGSGFISPEDQALYADYVNSVGYVTENEMAYMKENDKMILESLKEGRFADAEGYSQRNLLYIVHSIMSMTNIYDHTSESNYLTNNEFMCFVDQDHVRKGIHVGDAKLWKGIEAAKFLNNTIMVSKKPKLERTLDRGVEVLIYNGNLDLIVHIPGTNKMINSLQFNGRQEFLNSKRREFWVWNPDTERGELAGYITQGGGLFYATLKNAGHMTPISQPFRTHTLVSKFTHATDRHLDRFQKPDIVKANSRKLKSISDIHC